MLLASVSSSLKKLLFFARAAQKSYNSGKMCVEVEVLQKWRQSGFPIFHPHTAYFHFKGKENGVEKMVGVPALRNRMSLLTLPCFSNHMKIFFAGSSNLFWFLCFTVRLPHPYFNIVLCFQVYISHSESLNYRKNEIISMKSSRCCSRGAGRRIACLVQSKEPRIHRNKGSRVLLWQVTRHSVFWCICTLRGEM